MNDHARAIDDRLQPPGAKIFDRSASKIDNRFKFGNFFAGTKFRKLSPDKIDNQRSRQIDPA
jgi:hypothetical protein